MKKKNLQEIRRAAMAVPTEAPVRNRPEVSLEEKLGVPVDILPHIKEPELKKSRYDYHDINSAPRNGTLIVVSENENDKGTIVFWKRTRAFANATHKWEETGFFANNITNLRISFTPKYWRMKGQYEI